MKESTDTKNNLGQEIPKPKPKTTPKAVPTAGSIFIKATLLSLFFVMIMLIITAFGFGIWSLNKLNNFARLSGTSLTELNTIFQAGWNLPITQSEGHKNILLLGVDSLESRPGSPALTDTIMIISTNFKTGEISTISLPRDLWSDEYLTRINALYFYGQEKYPSEPQRFTKEVVENLTGVEIHHTIVISINSVAEIIDILDGVDIDVEQGFTDTEFPKGNVDVTIERDPAKLYETITFEKGLQRMDGERVLQYIRSRKSGDDQGDDISRSKRQQIVINSMIGKLQNFNLLADEVVLAKLYKYYNQNLSKQFSIEEGIASIKALYPYRNKLTFNPNKLSIFPQDPNGVISNPPVNKYKGEWVYEIRNRDLFKEEILSKLNLL
ncbi:MAG: LCP family protein [Pseudomonadales bacterium]|nr:LCP family protein [Pseudomonadales bacterium]